MYEYIVEIRAHESATQESAYLNRLAETGWELVSVTGYPGTSAFGWGHFYFRRPRQA